MMSQLKKRLKEQRGLTLVELLAVIVILGIISAIAVPSIGGLINKTKDDAKVAEAIQIINAAKIYVSSEGAPTNNTLNHSDLSSYLENVDNTNYTVTLTKENNGTYSYSISGHPAIKVINPSADDSDAVTEAQLHNH